jgi:hypothetical protein
MSPFLATQRAETEKTDRGRRIPGGELATAIDHLKSYRVNL